MWEWLFAPIDPSRLHEITTSQMWHARLMFLSWGFLAPAAILVARFFKVLPKQNWPQELDSQFWWRFHWISQSIVFVLTIAAVLIAYRQSSGPLSWHGIIGYVVLSLVIVQVIMGCYRGTKGGPGDPRADGTLDGDHYSMTLRRRCFEWVHKFCGYLALLLSMTVVAIGLWNVNGDRWMCLLVALWWCFILLLFIFLQRRNFALDTYQAIWGPDPSLPGNQRPSSGWGTHRRDDRRHKLR